MVDPALAWSDKLSVEVGGAGTVAQAGVVLPRLLVGRLGLCTEMAGVVVKAGFFPLRHWGRALVDAACSLAAGATCLSDRAATTTGVSPARRDPCPPTRPPGHVLTRPHGPDNPGTRSPEATLGNSACLHHGNHPKKINKSKSRSTHPLNRGIGSDHGSLRELAQVSPIVSANSQVHGSSGWGAASIDIRRGEP